VPPLNTDIDAVPPALTMALPPLSTVVLTAVPPDDTI